MRKTRIRGCGRSPHLAPPGNSGHFHSSPSQQDANSAKRRGVRHCAGGRCRGRGVQLRSRRPRFHDRGSHPRPNMGRLRYTFLATTRTASRGTPGAMTTLRSPMLVARLRAARRPVRRAVAPILDRKRRASPTPVAAPPSWWRVVRQGLTDGGSRRRSPAPARTRRRALPHHTRHLARDRSGMDALQEHRPGTGRTPSAWGRAVPLAWRSQRRLLGARRHPDEVAQRRVGRLLRPGPRIPLFDGPARV